MIKVKKEPGVICMSCGSIDVGYTIKVGRYKATSNRFIDLCMQCYKELHIEVNKTNVDFN